ncbi:Flp pilus assembly protein CpaB [Marinimicrobium sp. C2-29]|uniref:Flp pilus assembly protein CpaB n=1 Tax=Marinimicrobium sp. C2-29 TaxID=3139825 RepID=UPI0031397E03
MGKKRTVVLLLMSLVLALGAAWTANNWLQMRAGGATAGSDRERPVVIAAVRIPYGQKIESRHLSLVTLPTAAIPSNTFSEVAAVEGKVAREEILEGDILREERMVQHLHGSTLAAMIAENKRAMTVRVNDVIGVAGFLLPGNHVDIVSAKSKGRGEAETETVLNRIRVLAVDQTAGSEKDGRPVVVRAVTLEVTPAEGETLVKATEEGRIQLALRNPLDNREPEEPEQKEEPEPAVVVHRPRRPTTGFVTVIRGVDEKTTRVKH